jgi:hypothetical protein
MSYPEPCFLLGSARAHGGWRLANHNEVDEVKTHSSEVGHATPTGECASWQHARARAIPLSFSMVSAYTACADRRNPERIGFGNPPSFPATAPA